MKKSLFIFFVLQTIIVLSQEKLEVKSGCGFDHYIHKKTVYTFLPDEKAKKFVDSIMRYTGLQKNFIVKAANVSNAEAVFGPDNKRYILYNQYFMYRLYQTAQTDWALMGIFAHEIGHHLNGHTLTHTGSNPKIELEADKYIGFILYNMGATLDEALSCTNIFPNKAGGTYINGKYVITHPEKSSRIAAITSGWYQARDLFSKRNNNGQVIEVSDKTTMPVGWPVKDKLEEEKIKKISKKAKIKIRNIKIEHNVRYGFNVGMNIHFYLEAKNLKDRTIKVIAHLFNEENYLLSYETYTTLTYKSEYLYYKLFIPYNDLNLPRYILHNMKLFIRVKYKDAILYDSKWKKFQLQFN